MRKIKENPLILITSLLFFTCGIILLIISPKRVMNFIYIVLGTSIIFLGISKIMTATSFSDPINLVDGIINLLIGVLLIFFHNIIVTTIMAIFFLLMPIYRIIKAKDLKSTFINELPRLIIGVLIVFSGDLLVGFFVKGFGIALIILGIYFFVSIFLTKRVKSQKKDRSNSIDVDFEEHD